MSEAEETQEPEPAEPPVEEPEPAPAAPLRGPRLEPLVTAEETRRAEQAHEGSLDELMERAGTAVARVVLARFPGRVAVVCGGGNNGGDGRVCARVLREAGRDVTVVEGLGDLGEPDVVVDALLGIGLKEAPREDAARMIERINASGKPVVAIDVPSGVDASTGEVSGAAVRATVTVTFAAAKVGLAIAPGRAHAGSVQVAAIGLATPEHEHALVPATVLAGVPRKHRSSTKYRAGSVLVVGGSRGLMGAPMLTALAAFRADAGYVGIAAPESSLPVIESRLLEAVKWPLPEDSGGRLLARASDAVLEAAERADAIALGPGLGRTDGTRQLVRVLLERLELPVVVDADALWELEPIARAAPTVLTPHSGELARLLGATAEEVDAHRLQAVRRAASIYGAVVLLKGADTLVAAPRTGLYVAGYGQPSLATAGSGDVLTGIVAAFLAKGLEPQLAAAAAAVAHGLASRLAEPQLGLVASDLLPALQRALGGDGWQWPTLQ
jgi:NAD(P)H-hydrate epimerase